MGAVMDEPEDPASRLWRWAFETLLDEGSTPAEASDGANLVVAGYERRRAERGAAAPATSTVAPTRPSAVR
jgi:hypothetical protein